MSCRQRTKRRPGRSSVAGARVGLFGLMGQGNLGNDGSFEAMLAYLRETHPGLSLDVLCTGPDLVGVQYDIRAAHIRWYQPKKRGASGVTAIARGLMDMTLGMTVDSVRIASWVRRHDAVIVPGMGVLETTVPTRTWKTPYWMFLLSASGRLFGTKVALVSAGVNYIDERGMRMLIRGAARLAYYRSYRDTISRESMERMGLDTSADNVYPDVVFSLPLPQTVEGAAGTVGVGVMDYCGNNVDRQVADSIRSSYVEKLTVFVLWLVDNGRPVRLLTSDYAADAKIMGAIVTSVRAQRPDMDTSQLIAEPPSSIGELMRQTALVDIVVATRYHTVLCALKLAKPTIALSYAAKCEALMANMGMSEFCQSAKSLDVGRLKMQFEEIVDHLSELRVALAEKSAARQLSVSRQLADMSEALFRNDGYAPPVHIVTEAEGFASERTTSARR